MPSFAPFLTCFNVRLRSMPAVRQAGLACLVATGLVVGACTPAKDTPAKAASFTQHHSPAAEPTTATANANGMSTISVAQLPRQAQITYQTIHGSRNFAYEKDGVVFGNYEHILPKQARGYYREYTVASPNAHNRGAQRIVCGGKEVRQPDACYYTSNHYQSFQQIVNP